jgi:hypothetical protein
MLVSMFYDPKEMFGERSQPVRRFVEMGLVC